MPNHVATGLLTNLRIKRVALVDVGANLDKATGDGAHIMLFKRAVDKDAGPGLAAVHSDSPIDLDGDAEARRKKEEEEAAKPKTKETGTMKTLKEVLKGALAAMLEPDAAKRELAAKAAVADLEKIDEGGGATLDPAHVDALKQYAKALEGTIKAFGDGPHPATHPVHSMKRQYDEACTTLKAAGFDISEGTSKMDGEVEKKFSIIEKQNAELVKRLDAEIEKGVRAEVTSTLKSFRAVPLKLEGEGNDVDRYVEMYKSNRPLYDRQIELFKSADAQMASSAAFRNVGANGSGGTGDAWGRIEAEAEKLVAKSAAGSLTREAAIDKILLDPTHRLLVKQYREEQQ